MYKNVILKFFNEKVKHLLKVENCVVDFVVLDSENAMLVEINPFVIRREKTNINN